MYQPQKPYRFEIKNENNGFHETMIHASKVFLMISE